MARLVLGLLSQVRSFPFVMLMIIKILTSSIISLFSSADEPALPLQLMPRHLRDHDGVQQLFPSEIIISDFPFFVFLFQLTIIITPILMFSPLQRRSLVTIAQTSPPWPPSMRWSMQQSTQVRPRETMALMIWVTVM